MLYALVRVVQEIERPLAQALEGWILQQAVTGLMVGGKLEQAEALCSQVTCKNADTVDHEDPIKTAVRAAVTSTFSITFSSE